MSKESKLNFIEGSQDKDRLMIVQKMISLGISSRAIREWLGKEYDIGRSQQYKVLRAARLDMMEQTEMEREEIIAVNNARLEELVMRTFKGNDAKNALKAIDLINKTNGIYNTDTKTDTDNDKVIKIKFGE